ncbi:MAG: radical SAM protein [Alistipes sp.]|nr:radical SAM protein [Alistipes sp.]
MAGILLLTPPFVQPNCPYPATAYLKGFLVRRGIEAVQADLSVELLGRIYSGGFLRGLFARPAEEILPEAAEGAADTSHSVSRENIARIHTLGEKYTTTIDSVMAFLRGQAPELAELICMPEYLPQAGRFAGMVDPADYFGALGTADCAKYLATLYLQDLGDYIRATVTPHFGLVRYAETIAVSLPEFAPLAAELANPADAIDREMHGLLDGYIEAYRPQFVGFTIPFPGNLLSALKCARHIKRHHPGITLLAGGGYPTTELRSLSDTAVFDFFDHIILDDGEQTLENIIRGGIPRNSYTREGYYDRDGILRPFGMEESGKPAGTGVSEAVSEPGGSSGFNTGRGTTISASPALTGDNGPRPGKPEKMRHGTEALTVDDNQSQTDTPPETRSCPEDHGRRPDVPGESQHRNIVLPAGHDGRPDSHKDLFTDPGTPPDGSMRCPAGDNTAMVYPDSASCDHGPERPVSHAERGCPDFAGLPHRLYFSMLETPNPMLRIWSDGRWNKLTLAHGCYWGRCTFCDTGLDYIGRYDPVPAATIADWMDTVAAETGSRGFHFTDEAAPPRVLRDLSLELLRRRRNYVWWTNVRFDKAFTGDMCRLMAAAGCIAVSGGLETASDRLLALMEKGISIESATLAMRNFLYSGIMVHGYLMYGFPTQTLQETVDSLEVVRQMFRAGLLESAYWHRYAMTVHSPSGKRPGDFGITNYDCSVNPFANNEIYFRENRGYDIRLAGEAMRSALSNYMAGAGLDRPVHKWFGGKAPATTMDETLVTDHLIKSDTSRMFDEHARLLWLAPSIPTHSADGITVEMPAKTKNVRLTEPHVRFLMRLLDAVEGLSASATLGQARELYEEINGDSFLAFYHSKKWDALRECGLLQL